MRNLPGSGDSLRMVALFGGVPSVGRVTSIPNRDEVVRQDLGAQFKDEAVRSIKMSGLWEFIP
jgi:hypothetical protein